MSAVVISQPMLFPWVGMMEQVFLANHYVFYSDVQFSKGSFINRVQVKTALGSRWLTVPTDGLRLGQRIDEVRIRPGAEWVGAHLRLLEAAYSGSPWVYDMLGLVDSVYSQRFDRLTDLVEASVMALCSYFGLAHDRAFIRSPNLGISGSGSRRVLDIVLALGGNSYITGHGAKNYLDHHMFESSGVSVFYMDYQLLEYSQLHGPFTPYVSALDLVANAGKDGLKYIKPKTLHWKEFLNEQRN